MSRSKNADWRPSVHYNAREGHYRAVADECSALLQRRSGDGPLLWWKAISTGLEGSSSEAIRMLTELRGRRDLELPVSLALLHFHRRARNVDSMEVDQLEDISSSAKDSANDGARVLAAHLYLLTGEYGECRETVEDMITDNGVEPETPTQLQANAVTAWSWLLSVCGSNADRLEASLDLGNEPDYRQAMSACRGLLVESGRGGPASSDLDTLMARARYHDLGRQLERGSNAATERHRDCMDQLNHAIALEPSFLPGLLEKSKLMMLCNEWEQALEMANRVLSADDGNLEALVLVALHAMTREADAASLVDRIGDVAKALSRREPKNAALHHRTSALFARLAGTSDKILEVCTALCEKALRLQPETSAFHCELGYQRALVGRIPEAMDAYQTATRYDESNSNALDGMIFCLILTNNLDDAESQLELQAVISEATGVSALHHYLQALLAWRKSHDLEEQLKCLGEAVASHLATVRDTPYATPMDSLTAFDAQFLLRVANEYLQHQDPSAGSGTTLSGGADGSGAADGGSARDETPIDKGLDVLGKVVRQLPGLLEAHIAIAQARYNAGDLEAAAKALQHCVSLDSSRADTHLLMAQVSLAQGDSKLANHSLEAALSYDFQVRASPIYALARARYLITTGAVDESLTVLQGALRLPGVRSPSSTARVSLSERASIFVDLAATFAKMARLKEAAATIAEARDLFHGTAEEVRVLVANSELAIARNDFDGAMELLNSVDPDSRSYVHAQVVKANVYLAERHDKTAYVDCYREIVKAHPQSARAFVLLAEALMRVQAPELAVREFENAYHLEPGNVALATKIGNALVSTHDYLKAVDYYESALRDKPDSTTLRHDLVRLLTKLRNFPAAQKKLKYAMDLSGDRRNVSTQRMMDEVAANLLLADVYEKSSDPGLEETLKDAQKEQAAVLERCRAEMAGPEQAKDQRKLMAGICMRLAKVNEARGTAKFDEEALGLYTEALSTDELSEPCMASIARLHLRSNRGDECEAMCGKLRNTNAESDDAAMILADLKFLQAGKAETSESSARIGGGSSAPASEGKDDMGEGKDGEGKDGEVDDSPTVPKSESEVAYAAALAQYSELLEKKPNHYGALSQLIVLLRRAGKLKEINRFFKLAERSHPRARSHAGLHYCKGLYHRYTNSVHEAVKAFNLARRDGEWGRQALTNMIELYLNPDNDTLFGVSALDGAGGAVNAERMASVKAAEDLLGELSEMMPERDSKYRVLEAYTLMASRRKESMDEAMQKLVELLEDNANYLPGLLAMSTFFLLEGDGVEGKGNTKTKATSFLKKITKKMVYSQEYGDEFERAYLMLADINIGKGKFDLAMDLCRKCLTYNKSSGKAWEALGVVYEKEASYADAAECYEKAWLFENEASATVGFRLAFNYLKAKRYVEAIDVCHKVLRQFPDYPKIRKDILEKCQASLRP